MARSSGRARTARTATPASRCGTRRAERPVPTELDATLARGGAKRIVVCGLATDYCVKATALDGVRLGYETAVLLDGIRAVDLKPGDGELALEEMAAAGVRLIGVRSDVDFRTAAD